MEAWEVAAALGVEARPAAPPATETTPDKPVSSTHRASRHPGGGRQATSFVPGIGQVPGAVDRIPTRAEVDAERRVILAARVKAAETGAPPPRAW